MATDGPRPPLGHVTSEPAPALATQATHDQPGRHRLSLADELVLAVLPTLTVLLVLWLVEAFAARQVLFASLASSAFLIYRDPEHRMNSARTLLAAQVLAAGTGFAADLAFGPSYAAAAVALGVSIFTMIALDVVHPPAIGTALTFAFRPQTDDALPLFLLALVLVVVLTGLSTVTTRLLRRLTKRREAKA